jgi:hypothetical protein
MTPKKRPEKELLAEGSSQAARGQVLTTTEATVQTTHIHQIAHSHPSTDPHAATIEAKRPKDPSGQPTTQVEAFVADASTLNTLPPPLQQHQAIEIQEDQQQDSEEEIKVVIKDELARLR